ncbi:spindle assembly abnormal protein 6 homolog [Bombina bombina]|uniref:spindle assembly abnormal protein 6 homolog n=1 Tax=Bombina bombina TaxID=8345 RepID=UPI00235AD002|nr:spindle assembly abnormal protein 6 homolog [Bombina bombina]
MSQVQELLTRNLKVLLRSRDTEERTLILRICIELHLVTSPVHKKELVVRVTDDTDPLFLYHLVISEDDFQSLKTQQGLLVDFSAFPQKFIDLIHHCAEEEIKAAPRFLLQLSSSASVIGGSAAQLDVVETNPFKHLTHLSLRLLPASDLEIKSFLSSTLRCIKDEKKLLQETLKKTEEDLRRQLGCVQQSLSEKSRELETLRSEWSHQLTAANSQHSAELTSEREKAQQTQTQLLHQYEQQMKNSETSHQQSTQHMQSRLTELEHTNKEMLERRYKAEATIRELRTKYQGLEEEAQRAQQEVISLRRENSALDAECHEKEKDVNRLQMRLAVQEQELKDKEQLVLRSNEALKATQAQKELLEVSAEKKQELIGKLEATIKSLSAELLKANEIIKKLQLDVKSLMGKVKLKNAVTVQQEKLLSAKERKIEEEQRLLQDARHQLQLKDKEVGELQDQLQQTERKLEETKELLQTNENVISWLNKQLNDNESGKLIPSSAHTRTSALPSPLTEKRFPFLASQMNYPLLSSYPAKPFIPSTFPQQPLQEETCPGPRVQYNNMLLQTNCQSSAAPQGNASSKVGANKEK